MWTRRNLKLSLAELHLGMGPGGAHRGWRSVAGWSKEERVWSPLWKGGMQTSEEWGKEEPGGEECSAEVSCGGVQWRQNHIWGLSPALLGYLGVQVEKADRVLVVSLNRKFSRWGEAAWGADKVWAWQSETHALSILIFGKGSLEIALLWGIQLGGAGRPVSCVCCKIWACLGSHRL